MSTLYIKKHIISLSDGN